MKLANVRLEAVPGEGGWIELVEHGPRGWRLVRRFSSTAKALRWASAHYQDYQRETTITATARAGRRV